MILRLYLLGIFTYASAFTGFLLLRSDQFLFDGYSVTVNLLPYIVGGALALLAVLTFKRKTKEAIATALTASIASLYLLEASVTAFEVAITPTTPEELVVRLEQNLGGPVDTRTAREALADLQRTFPDARGVLTPFTMMPSADASGGFPIGEQTILPVNALGGRRILHCNEGGVWQDYMSDRYGYRNPDHVHEMATVDAVLVGDSYTHGSCVGDGEDSAAYLRDAVDGVLNLGLYGNGPLLQLATLKEIAAAKTPRLVFWMYFDGNDFPSDLDSEKRNPILRRYLEDGFSQNIIRNNDAIQSYLLDAFDRRFEAGRFDDALRPNFWDQFYLREFLTNGRLRKRVRALNPVLNPDYALMERVLTTAKAAVEDWGGELVFVYQPGWRTVHDRLFSSEREVRDRVLSIAEDVGLPVFDLLPTMQAVPDRGSLFQFQNSHYNTAGYRIVGELLSTIAQEKLAE